MKIFFPGKHWATQDFRFSAILFVLVYVFWALLFRKSNVPSFPITLEAVSVKMFYLAILFFQLQFQEPFLTKKE